MSLCARSIIRIKDIDGSLNMDGMYNWDTLHSTKAVYSHVTTLRGKNEVV